MEVRTDFPSSMYHTKLQWAQLGKALNADAVGIEMWVNSCQINRAIFYTVDEVHNGTQTELDEVLEPLRKKAEASRVARLREKEERLIARPAARCEKGTIAACSSNAAGRSTRSTSYRNRHRNDWFDR